MDGGLAPCPPADALDALARILVHLAEGQPLSRGDLITVITAAQTQIDPRITNDSARFILDTTFQAVAQSIKDDPSVPLGVRLDIPEVATTMITKFVDDHRQGLYLRATIGAGYFARNTLGYERQAQGSGRVFYEEIGFGYRCAGAQAPQLIGLVPAPFLPSILQGVPGAKCKPSTSPILWGPHFAASGLLFEITGQNVNNKLFVGEGLSVNFYKLIDVSVTAGPMWDLAKRGYPSPAIFAGLQLPLSDYVTTVMQGNGAPSVTSTGSGK
jgi:hypothetical protein